MDLRFVEDFFEGGHSICRNSSLHKMFEMIGGGERAGSGADTSACSVHQFT